ncbi:MAG: alpha/beta hydrolase [Pseudomonas sp.]
MLKRPFLPVALVLTGALLSACASNPNDLKNPHEAIAAFAAKSYQAPQQGPSQGWDAEFTVAEQAIDVSWLAPAQHSAAAPLVVFLPGLGEGAHAGLQWRRTWADAGYAVVSIQPQQYGRGIYSSSEAQAGTFRGMAQRAYSDKALSERIAVVQQVLNQLRVRGQAGDAQVAGVDWQNVVLAGYDLGAQTAAALAGDAMLAGWQPKAVILLSPYVGPGSAAARVDVPLLSITGPHDEDPFSWVDSPERRQAIWRGNPNPGSYQLIAKNAQHQLFSGSLEELPSADSEGHKPPKRDADLSPGAGGRDGTSGPPGADGGEGPKRRPQPDTMGHGQDSLNWFDAHQVANVQGVSTAFLDATVRGAAPAKAWLKQNAPQAIGPAASIEAR